MLLRHGINFFWSISCAVVYRKWDAVQYAYALSVVIKRYGFKLTKLIMWRELCVLYVYFNKDQRFSLIKHLFTGSLVKLANYGRNMFGVSFLKRWKKRWKIFSKGRSMCFKREYRFDLVLCLAKLGALNSLVGLCLSSEIDLSLFFKTWLSVVSKNINKKAVLRPIKKRRLKKKSLKKGGLKKKRRKIKYKKRHIFLPREVLRYIKYASMFTKKLSAISKTKIFNQTVSPMWLRKQKEWIMRKKYRRSFKKGLTRAFRKQRVVIAKKVQVRPKKRRLRIKGAKPQYEWLIKEKPRETKYELWTKDRPRGGVGEGLVNTAKSAWEKESKNSVTKAELTFAEKGFLFNKPLDKALKRKHALVDKNNLLATDTNLFNENLSKGNFKKIIKTSFDYVKGSKSESKDGIQEFTKFPKNDIGRGMRLLLKANKAVRLGVFWLWLYKNRFIFSKKGAARVPRKRIKRFLMYCNGLKKINAFIGFKIISFSISTLIRQYYSKSVNVTLKMASETRGPVLNKIRLKKLRVQFTQRMYQIFMAFTLFDATILSFVFKMILRATYNKRHVGNLLVYINMIKQYLETGVLCVCGMRLKIKGRLGGKLRKGCFGYKMGRIQLLVYRRKISFACDTVVTYYGSFSVKVWLAGEGVL